jgi:CO/xanthine dehydrogenase Mo-binding subunit
MCCCGKDSPQASFVGQSAHRQDAFAKVTGKARYPGDLNRPGMLHMKILFAGRPHAKILNIDTSRALTSPGVVAVLTAEDVPHNEYGLAVQDQPVLCKDLVRFEGDQVALVIAESEAAAATARTLIQIEYENLPVVTDPRRAMEPGSPQLHADYPSNILRQYRIRRGSLDEGVAEADVIVEGEYYLPMQEHAYLQPEAALAYMDGETVVVETAAQSAHDDQNQIAHALGFPLEHVPGDWRRLWGAGGRFAADRCRSGSLEDRQANQSSMEP